METLNAPALPGKNVGIGSYPIVTISHAINTLQRGGIGIAGDKTLEEMIIERGSIPFREGGRFQIKVIPVKEGCLMRELPEMDYFPKGFILGSDFHLLAVLAYISEHRGEGAFKYFFNNPKPVLVRSGCPDRHLVVELISDKGRGKINFALKPSLGKIPENHRLMVISPFQ